MRTITAYNNHQNSHKNLENFDIICLYRNCHAKLTSYQSFQKHISRKHQYADGEGNYLCKLQNCNFQTSNFQLINKHVKSHLNKPNNGIPCPFSRCERSSTLFLNENNFTVHVFRNHFDEDTLFKNNSDSNLEGIPNYFEDDKNVNN